MDELKAAWNNTAGETPKRTSFKPQPPVVVKQVKTQMLIEGAAWLILLVVFRDFFDGAHKPLYLNVMLAIALLLMLMHNVAGYLAARNLVNGPDLRASLTRYAHQLKTFGIVAVAGRAAGMSILLWFFASAIQFTTTKYWLLAGIVGIFSIQLLLLGRVWSARVQRIQASLKEMAS